MVTRGEVWLAELDPTVGKEIQKTRPCLIVSPDEMNRVLGTVTVTPMTTGGWPARFRARIRFDGKDGFSLPDQIRTLDKSRLVRPLGRIEDASLQETLRVLMRMFKP